MLAQSMIRSSFNPNLNNPDNLKYDWCNASSIHKNEQLPPVYQQVGDALRATGGSILYSLCEYRMGSEEKWGADAAGNRWRATDDIRDERDSMMFSIEKQVPTAPYAGPGHWNDPDATLTIHCVRTPLRVFCD
jgi:alpha-galactosidase